MNPGKRLALGAYINGIESRRTSKNGVFGIKIHWRHIKSLLVRKVPEAVAIQLLMRHEKFIFLTRRDKLRQAISYHIAESTGIFHSDQQDWLKGLDAAAPELSPERILRHLADILDEERGWADFFRESGKPFIRIEYEDLVSDYAGTCSRILDFLNVEAGAIPQMTPRMEHRGLQEQFRDGMLGIMGIEAGRSNASE